MTNLTEFWYAPYLLGQACSDPPCACPDGFTGRSDWVNAEGMLCHINIWAIRALWIINVAVWMYVLITGAPKFAQLYHRFLRKVKLSNLPQVILVILVFFVMVMPCVLTVAFLRIFNFDMRIPFDLNVTIPWFLGRALFYCGTALHQPSLMKKVLEAENKTERHISVHLFRERAVSIVAALNGLLFIPVYYGRGVSPVLERACFAVYLAIQGTCFLLLYIIARSIEKRLGAMLRESYDKTKSEAVLVLRARLLSVQSVVMFMTGLQATFYFAWLACPPLWVVHDYFLPVSWLIVPLVANKTLDSVYVRNRTEENQLEKFKRDSKEQAILQHVDSDRQSARFLQAPTLDHMDLK